MRRPQKRIRFHLHPGWLSSTAKARDRRQAQNAVHELLAGKCLKFFHA